MGLFSKKSKDNQDAGAKVGFFKSLFGGGGNGSKGFETNESNYEQEATSIAPKIEPIAGRGGNKKANDIVNIKVSTLPKADVSQLRAALHSLNLTADALITNAQESQDLSNTLAFLVETIGNLKNASLVALGHRQNVLALSNFFIQVINTLNAQRIVPENHCSALRSIQPYVDDAVELATSSCQPGWLSRMARSEAMHVEFSRIHLSTIAMLRAKGMDGRACSIPAKYRDYGQQLKKVLKALGDGSLDQGVLLLRSDAEAQQHIADLLSVSLEDIINETHLENSVVAGTELVTDTSQRHAECNRVFIEYITTSKDRITADGFQQLMVDMGLLDCLDTFDHPAVARATMVDADCDFDGALSYAEFCDFYIRYPITAVRLQVRTLMGLRAERRIYDVFAAFAAFGAGKKGACGSVELGLDCSRFAKLCRDCDLFHSGMTSHHVDVVFTGAKPKDERRMNFDYFLCSLGLIAQRQGQTMERIARTVAQARGPAMRATRTGFIKLHDDKSMFTGVYARGGPSFGSVNLDLPSLVARTKDPPGTPRQPTGEIPMVAPPTRPESPVLATKHRVSTSGPTTPGRGAPLLATEARAAARAAALASPRGQPAVFGRTTTPRAAALTTPRGQAAFGRTVNAASTPRSASVKKSLIPPAPLNSQGTMDDIRRDSSSNIVSIASMIPGPPSETMSEKIRFNRCSSKSSNNSSSDGDASSMKSVVVEDADVMKKEEEMENNDMVIGDYATGGNETEGFTFATTNSDEEQED